MFDLSKPRKRGTQISLLISFVAHCAVVLVWLDRPPIFVQPSSVAWGLHGNSENLIYFPRSAESAKTTAHKLHYKPKPKRKAASKPEDTLQTARAGSENGSMFNGPVTGTDARPALPLVFPDPDIYPWQLANLQGDVIVEVTIDEKGIVTQTRVLQSLKTDIDRKVVAILKTWRFKPASVDGTAISSRQDVHFHFPS
jgi:TonB family protein